MPYATYIHFTKEIPDFGGTMREGVIGNPRYINPLLAQDADKDLVSLIYSGLMKYDENGKIVTDIAESYTVSEDGLSYTFKLKQNVKWHDGEDLTADDVIFTIHAIQDANYGSPQRVNWQGIDVNQLDEHTVNFTLKNKYGQFLNNMTLGILPEHVWSNIKSANFSLSEFNTKPVGTGPYKFDSFKKNSLGQIESYKLRSFNKFYDHQAYITHIEFKFYLSEETMIEAYNRSEIDNLSFISAQRLKSVRFQPKLNINTIALPRYFGVFFNESKGKILEDQNLRIALNQGTDKQAIIDRVLEGHGRIVDSPMLPGILDIPANTKKYDFNIDQAKATLDSIGWKVSEEGTRVKENKPKSKNAAPEPPTKLEIELTTSDWPELVDTAEELQSQWKQLGVSVNIRALPVSELQQVIKERDYEALLFGEILNIDPDPFSFWHSSQKRDPGLNLALFDNKDADKLLEEARQISDFNERRQKYAQFQDIVISQAPIVLLYSSDYIYPQLKKVKNNNTKIIAYPSGRFDSIINWYISTKRVLK